MKVQNPTKEEKSLFEHAQEIFETMPGLPYEKDCLIQGTLITLTISTEYPDFKISANVSINDTVQSVREKLQQEFEEQYTYLTDMDERTVVEYGRSFDSLTMGFSNRLSF